MDILNSLNPMQREAAVTTEGPLLLLAGAGSGKTRTVCHRIAYLIEKGVKPFNILAITFTNKAAREMRERIGRMVKESDEIWVSTFHSACVRILRREINKLGYDGKFTIYDADDSEKLMKTIIKELNINDKLYPPKSVLGEIGRRKDELVSPEEMALSVQGDFRMMKIAELYQTYQKRLKASNALDFDDIIYKTVELFATFPQVLDRYQNRFLYIHVDEYQDTNTAQYRLVHLLSTKYKNICVVGDDDQSIYGWRGANIRNILDFEKDYPGAKVLRLEQNYRSTQNILNAANSVIKNNRRRKGKTLWTENKSGSKIVLYKAQTDILEAEFVISEILRRSREGEPFKGFAVLYRTNAQSRLFEDQLVRRGVPYRIFGGVRFYERREVKDVLAYLKAIYNPLDDISVKRIINVPRRGIGNETVAQIEAYAARTELPFFKALKDADEIFVGSSPRISKIKFFVELINEFSAMSAETPVSELISKLLERTAFMEELLSEKDQDAAKERAANVMELLAKAQEFEKQSENASLDAFLEEVSLVADIDNYSEANDAVVLMTMHSAKGLEFDCVFVVGFEEGIFPGFRASSSSDENEMEEERRVCYVAITRARESLYVTCARERRMYGRVEFNSPSRFLREIPREFLEEVNGTGLPFTEVKGVTVSVGNGRLAEATATALTPRRELDLPQPKSGPPEYEAGDYVRQKKYGKGKVLAISPAGADYEVAVDFPGIGIKKFMAHLSNLEKIDDVL